MKNLVCLLFGFILCIPVASGKSLEFEMLSTDYNGILYSGNKILVYGNYGIITFSTDLGTTWRQISLGWENDILKIIQIDDKLYALSPNKIFISDDNGETWQEAPIQWESNFVDFCTDGKKVYIVTENEILSFEKEQESDINLLYKFDPFVKFTEVAVWKNFLFIIDSKVSIIKFNILTKIPTDTLTTGFSNREIENLKVIDSTIYVLVVSNESSPLFDLNFLFIRHTILVSKDFGESWKKITSDLPITKDYLIEGDEAYTLAPVRASKKDDNFTISFVKANKEGVNIVTEVSNPNAWIPYLSDVEDKHPFQVNEIKRINDSTIIVCGTCKTIIISKDNGNSWNFVSYFRPFIVPEFSDVSHPQAIDNIFYQNKDKIFILSFYPPYMFISYDNGTTFKSLKPDTSYGWFNGSYYPLASPNGKLGFFIINRKKPTGSSDTIIIKHFDIVNDTLSKNDTLMIVLNEYFKPDSIQAILFGNSFYFKSRIYLPAFLILYNSNKWMPSYFVFNNDLQLIDTIFNPPQISMPFVVDDNYIYSISKDSNFTYILRTQSLRSDLDTIAIIPQIEIRVSDLKVYITLLKVLDGCFFFTKTTIEGSIWKWNLLIFDSSNGNLDSIEVPSPPILYNFGDTLILLCDYWMRFYPNCSDTSLYYEYTNPNINGWKMTSIFRVENQDYVSFVKKFSVFIDKYEVNLGKLKLKHSFPSIAVEESKPFLFCFPPYPNPSVNFTNIVVCWDSGFTSEDIKVSIYNINGQKLEIPYTQVEGLKTNCSIIRLFTSNLPDGIYIAKIQLQNSQWSVPFVKSK